MDLSAVTRDVTRPARVDPAGVTGPTKDQARGARWRRTSRGYYVPASVENESVDQRVVEAAAALQEEYGGVTGWAALGWLSDRWFDGTPWGGGKQRLVTLAVGGNRWIRPQPTFETSEERLAPGELSVVDGVRLTIPVRSVCFEMRYAKDERAAAVTLSMACYDDLVSIDEVAAFAAGLNGWTGIPRCRAAVPLATENAWSPAEVDMAHVWTLDAHLPQPLHNVPVFDLDGKLLGTPDLLDPSTGVYGEYDGALHLAGTQRSKDVGREANFRSHGLEGAVMLAGDRHNSARFVDRLQETYDRAADVPDSRRRWTIEQPDWWTDTTSVAARRALSARQRATLLRHRAA